MKYIIMFMLFCSTAFANDSIKMYASGPGNVESIMITKVLGQIPVQKQGAEGLLMYRAMDNDSNSVATNYTSIMYLSSKLNPEYNFNPIKKYKIHAVIAESNTLIVTSNKLKTSLTDKTITLAGFGKNSLCAIFAKKYSEENGINIKYIPYRTASQKTLDIISGRVDAGCIGGTELSLLKDPENGLTQLRNISEEDGMGNSIYVISNKDIDSSHEKKLIEVINAAKSNLRDINQTLEATGYHVIMLTGKEKDDYVNKHNQFWIKTVNNYVKDVK